MMNPVRTQSQPYQLQNAIREGILQRQFGKGLVVLEGLYALNYAAETWLTFAEIYSTLRQAFGCSRRLVYEGLQSKLIFQRRKAKPRAYQAGARPYFYRVPSPQELKAEFAPQSEDTPSDVLQNRDLKSLHCYRLGLHREFMLRLCKAAGITKGFVIHRGLQADRSGVSKRTIRSYDKKLGFSHEANYAETEISWANWDKLPRYKQDFSADGKRLPSRKWLKVVDWKTGRSRNLPHVAYLAYSALKDSNFQVYEMERVANRYFPYRRPDPSRYQGGTYSIDFYMDEVLALEEAGFKQQDNSWVYQRE